MGRFNSTSTVSNQGYNNLSKLSHSNRLNNKSGKECSSQNYLKIYHQNICGLKCKINELLSSLYPNLPHYLYQ
jgi:DNA polymerase III alpha subunit